MVYYRRRRTPRRSYRSRRRYSRRSSGPTYMQMGRKVFKDVQMLKNLINVEFKTLDTLQTAAPDSTGTITLLNNVSQGDGTDNRDGNQFRIKSLQVHGHVKLNASATDTQVRHIYFIWKNVNGASPTIADILDGSNVNDLKNLDNKRNLVVLKDMTFTLNTNYPRKIISFYKKLDLKTLYQQGVTSGSVTGMEYGGLYVLRISNESTNTPGTDINNRIRFIDN